MQRKTQTLRLQSREGVYGQCKIGKYNFVLLSVTSFCVCLFEQEVILQGRELAKQAEEMSTRNLRDKRPLQTASKVLTSDLENFGNRVEHVKRWLEDAVNFYNLLNKARDPSIHRYFMQSLFLLLQTSGLSLFDICFD